MKTEVIKIISFLNQNKDLLTKDELNHVDSIENDILILFKKPNLFDFEFLINLESKIKKKRE